MTSTDRPRDTTISTHDPEAVVEIRVPANDFSAKLEVINDMCTLTKRFHGDNMYRTGAIFLVENLVQTIDHHHEGMFNVKTQIAMFLQTCNTNLLTDKEIDIFLEKLMNPMMAPENADSRSEGESKDLVYIQLSNMLGSTMFARDRKTTIPTKELRRIFETTGGTKMTSHVFNKLIDRYCNFHVHVTMTRVGNAKSIRGLRLVPVETAPEIIAVPALIEIPQIPIHLPPLQ